MIKKLKKMNKIILFKQLIYMLLIIVLLILNSCIFNIKPPKPILEYPKTNMLENLPLKIDISWILEKNVSPEGYTFEVYYGKSPNALSSKISVSNTYATIKNLEPETIYYLKIRSIKGSAYTDSNLYEFKTTDIPKISFNITKNTIYTDHFQLSWEATDRDGIKKYELYQSNNSDFADSKKIYEGLNNFFTIYNLEYGKKYYFKLIAYDNLNVASEKNVNIQVSDAEFYGFLPSNNSKSIPIGEINFSWNYTFDSNYLFIFSPNQDFTDDGNYYMQRELSEKNYTLRNLPSGMTFYWKVVDVRNNISSPVLSFTTSYKPEIELTYPKKTLETENFAVGVTTEATITWEATDLDNDPLTFTITLKKIDENTNIDYVDFSEQPIFQKTTNNRYFPLSLFPLEKNTFYALRVDVDDGKGNFVIGKPIKFRTNLAPSKPYNLHPNNEINIPTDTVTLTWEGFDPDDGVHFNVYFGESSTNLTFKDQTNKNYYIIHNLEYNKKYFWKIEAIDSNNATSISDIAFFTTNKKPIFKSISPENDATNISLKPSFIWNFEDDNISFYKVYFSKDSDELSLIATTTNNSFNFSNYILPETRYKWEIIAYDSANASETSGINYFVTTNKPNIEPTIPNNNSNNVSLKPVFSWNASDPDNDALNYTLNINSSGVLMTYDSLESTSFEIPDYLTPGTEYSWSIIATDSNLATAISATQTFKTTQQPTITLIFPLSQSDMDATVTLNWNANDPNNDNLIYYIYLNDTEVGTTSNSTFVLSELAPNTIYSWKIVVMDSNFATAISEEATFSTGTTPNTNPDITNIYDYYEPTKEYTLSEEKYPNKLKILWNPVPDITQYAIYKKSNDEESLIKTNITDTYAIINIPEGGKYDIFVRAYNNKGFYSESEHINLNINIPPILQDFSPRNGETNVSLTPKIIWFAEDLDSSTFNGYIYFGESENNLNNYEYISNANNSSEYTLKEPLLPGKDYYWKIHFEDEMHGITESEIRKFTTTQKPEITYVNLSNNSTNIALNLTLEWNAYDPDEDILSYNIQLIKSGELENDINTTNNSYTFSLTANSNYILKLTAKDTKGSNSSTEIYFTTTQNPIIYNNSLIPDSFNHFKNGDKISWNAYDPDGDNLSYEIYIGKLQNSLTLVGTTDSNNYILNNLDNNQIYYWKIIAYDNKGGKSSSEIKQFKTNAIPEFDNSRFYPENNSPGIEKNLTLRWFAHDNDNDILKYDIYLGNNKSNLTKIATDYTYNTYNILLNSETYYWKVIAKDSYGGITESEILNFYVNKPPDLPEINYTLLNGLEASISWKSTDPEGQNITYDLLKSIDDSSYSTELYNTIQTNYYAERLVPNTTYYWKVRSIDEKNDSSEATISFTTENPDTNIFTIEKGSSEKIESIIDLVEFTTNDFVFIQKEDNTYYLTKIDRIGTETTINSSSTINITPYFLDNNSDILLIGIGNGKISFEEYDNNLVLNGSTSTNIPATTIKDFIKLPNNDYLVLGNNSGNAFISKIDITTGSTILNSLYYNNSELNAGIQIVDNDGNNKYIICGTLDNKGYLIKMDEKFIVEDEKNIDSVDTLVDIIQGNDSFIVLGFKNNDLIVKEYNYRLNELWSPIYENSFETNIAKINKTSDGYIILLNTLDGNIELLKTDNNINITKKATFGRNGEDFAKGIIQTSDNGYIIFGKTKSFKDQINGNSYIIKTDSKLLGWITPE
ncbi:hypothetical protein SAMN02745164_00035 [Marinitoga hydrogenitolerans DSM 16785]|uniref:Fibronectin type-III domain-containing protein n=1 Tax=Marinitoga hydrogenitolerans (strain DSM 16785 / JCM 12826 / AT1271) TaxID=1122195 RepID=A0A1M4S509_MARH1|nr:fibronectin type III domain-containing protein [Marinitoga hydrogenitolerans]SHE27288.1 hypothetical protein SAMN02745164_00035 [Marinitoga hydrogenitolerans DSM 16785]